MILLEIAGGPYAASCIEGATSPYNVVDNPTQVMAITGLDNEPFLLGENPASVDLEDGSVDFALVRDVMGNRNFGSNAAATKRALESLVMSLAGEPSALAGHEEHPLDNDNRLGVALELARVLRPGVGRFVVVESNIFGGEAADNFFAKATSKLSVIGGLVMTRAPLEVVTSPDYARHYPSYSQAWEGRKRLPAA